MEGAAFLRPFDGYAGLWSLTINVGMNSPNLKPVVPERRIDAAATASCAFCRHTNPPDARYCNRCGAPLAATPCPRCGTISDAGAHSCKTCGADLGDRVDDTLFQPLPPAFKPGGPARAANRDLPEPVPSWDSPLFILDPPGSVEPERTDAAPTRNAAPERQKSSSGIAKLVIATAAILAVLAVIAALASRRDASPPVSATGAVTVSPVAPGPEAAPATAPAAAKATDHAPAGARASSTAASSATPARATGTSGTPSSRTRTDPVPPPRPAVEAASPSTAPPPARVGPCTEAVAALGLCTLPAAPAKEQ